MGQFFINMDPQVLLICIVVVILSTSLIYAFHTLTMRERPFEAIDWQKYEQDAQGSRVLESKKEKKKRGKKRKESDASEVCLEEDDRIKVDDGEGDMERHIAKVGKTKKVKKRRCQECIKENMKRVVADDKSQCSNSSDEEGEDHFSVVQTEVPQDISEGDNLYFNFLHTESRNHLEEDSQSSKATSEIKKIKQKAKPDLNKNSIGKVAVEQNNSSTTETISVKEKKKSKKESQPMPQRKSATPCVVEKLTAEGIQLISDIQLMTLSDADVKRLFDVLLGKLSSAEISRNIPGFNWTKKCHTADPIALLRQAINEKDKALFEGQKRLVANSAKIQELTVERQKLSTLLKQNEELLINKVHENQALQACIHESHSQHLSEVAHLRSQLDTMTKQAAESHGKLQRISDEYKVIQDLASKARHLTVAEKTIEELRKKITVMDSALKQNVKMYNSSENSKKTMEMKIKVYEEKLQSMESNSKELSRNSRAYKDMEMLLKQSEMRVAALTEELERRTSLMRTMDEKVATFASELSAQKDKINDLQKENMRLNESLLEFKSQNVEYTATGGGVLPDGGIVYRDWESEMVKHDQEVNLLREQGTNTLTDCTNISVFCDNVSQTTNDKISEKHTGPSLHKKEAGWQEKEARYSELCRKEADWIKKETRFAELCQKEAEWQQKEAQYIDLCLKESEWIQKEAKLNELVEKEACWNLVEVELNRLHEKEATWEDCEMQMQCFLDKERKIVETHNQQMSETLKNLEAAERKLQDQVAEIDSLKKKVEIKTKEYQSKETEMQSANDRLSSDNNHHSIEIMEQLSAARQTEDKLQLEVNHYKTALADMENLLSKLQNQSKVETEEDKELLETSNLGIPEVDTPDVVKE